MNNRALAFLLSKFAVTVPGQVSLWPEWAGHVSGFVTCRVGRSVTHWRCVHLADAVDAAWKGGAGSM